VIAAFASLLLLAAGLARPGVPLAPAADPGDEPRAAASVEDVETATVQVVTIRRDSEARVARGSAFYVSAEGYLLTCAHVIDHLPGDEARRIRSKDGLERPFEVLHIDHETDVALLAAAPAARFIELGDASLPEAGTAVVLAGYPVRPSEGGRPRLKPAYVVGVERRRISGVRHAVGSRRTIVNLKVDEIADAGQSGGPLLADGVFFAVGIVRANLERETGGLGGGKPEGNAVAVPLMYVLPVIGRPAK
jgi:S1-C subfamily serine protease